LNRGHCESANGWIQKLPVLLFLEAIRSGNCSGFHMLELFAINFDYAKQILLGVFYRWSWRTGPAKE
jgi:hypothetical protein